MADLKLKGFVDEDDFQKLIELDRTVERVRANYASAAKELAKGLKINVEGIADLEKLHSIYTTQSKNASSASNELTEALKKQSEISQTTFCDQTQSQQRNCQRQEHQSCRQIDSAHHCQHPCGHQAGHRSCQHHIKEHCSIQNVIATCIKFPGKETTIISSSGLLWLLL